MDSGLGEIEKLEYKKPKVGINNQGSIVVKNRAWRRIWKNRAMIEGKCSKKWYTTKMTKSRRKRG